MSDSVLKIILFSIVLLIDVSILLFTVIKKTKIVTQDTLFEQLLVRLPDIILAAEKLFKLGSDKKEFVLSCCYSFLSQYSGRDVLDIAKDYGDRLDLIIENILKTPQRKESI